MNMEAHKQMGIRRIILILFIIFFTGSSVSAATVAWDSSGSGLWTAAANWNTDKVPGRGDDVVINAGSGTVTVDSNPNIKTLTLGGSQSLVISTARVTINNYAAIASDSTVDVHLHASINSGSAVAQDLVNLMSSNNFSIFIVMDTPKPIYQDPDSSSYHNKDFFSVYPGSFLFMYGGSELQPLLFATGHSGEITLSELYPNGGAEASQADIDQLNAIAADPTAWESTFKARATQAAESGLYVGFGELAPAHYSLRSGHPQMIYKVDTPWMLWLSDLAASYNMVLDIHMEATDTTLTQFANLLNHNTNTKIIWDHAGWSNSGGATASVISGLMAAHPNLYLSLKMRGYNSGTDPNCSPVDSSGNLKSEWQTLLTNYADRIMVGNDSKYWSDSTAIADELSSSYNRLNNMLQKLSAATQLKIRNETAKRLFGF
jgi:hypothetical protein